MAWQRWMTKLGPGFFGAGNHADRSPVVIQGTASQTANLLEVYDSADNLIASIDATGVVASAGGLTNPADNSVALAKLVRGTNGQLAIGQTGAATAYKALSGDITVDKDGVTTLADGLVHTASVTLTNSQLKNLRATPITLVARAGANKVISLVSGTVVLKAGANVLTEAGYNLGIKYNDGSGVQVSQTIECTGFIDQAVDKVTSVVPALDAIASVSAAANVDLVLHNVGGAEFGGNAAADATLIVHMAYRIRPTA